MYTGTMSLKNYLYKPWKPLNVLTGSLGGRKFRIYLLSTVIVISE